MYRDGTPTRCCRGGLGLSCGLCRCGRGQRRARGGRLPHPGAHSLQLPLGRPAGPYGHAEGSVAAYRHLGPAAGRMSSADRRHGVAPRVRGAGCCGASWCGPRGGGGCLNSNSRCTNRFVRSSWLTPAAVSAIDQAKLRRPGLMCGLRRVDRNHASVQPGRVGMGISPAHEADSFLCCHSAEWLLMAETAAASTPEPRAWHRSAPARHRKASTPYLL